MDSKLKKRLTSVGNPVAANGGGNGQTGRERCRAMSADGDDELSSAASPSSLLGPFEMSFPLWSYGFVSPS